MLCLLAGTLGGGAAATTPGRMRPWYVTQIAPLPPGPWDADAAARAPAGEATARLLAWPRAVLRLVVKYQQNPLRAARALAYVQVALHDAWVHARRQWPRAAVARHEWAAHRAASLVMAQLYPHETAGQFEASHAALGARLDLAETGREAAEALGRQVASALIERSLRDGSGRVWSSRQRPAEFPGAWQPTWPLFAVNPTEGLAPHWLPWVQPSAGRYDPPPAPRPGSARHRRETQEVLDVHRALSAEQIRLAQAWNLEAGSVTPGGVWMQLALRALAERVPTQDAAHATALALDTTATLAVAMHDAFIDCWRVKMRDWSERPITAVRRDLDARFTPLLVTPGFPSYVSGHACVSAAAATVLAHALPERAAHWAALAREAADSRLWGGIHFHGDDEEGLRLGRSVGQDVVAARLAD